MTERQRRRVAITGLGLVCSQGQSPQAVFEAWCAGQSGIAVHAICDAPYTVTGPLAVCGEFGIPVVEDAAESARQALAVCLKEQQSVLSGKAVRIGNA